MAQYVTCGGCGRIQTNHHSGRCTRCRAGQPPPPPGPHRHRAPRGPRPSRHAQPAASQSIPPAAVAKKAGELLLEALAKLEDALVAKAAEQGVNDETERMFARYQKVKAMALHPATGDIERQAALRTALVEAIRMVV